MLNESQQKKALEVWRKYASGEHLMPNPSGVSTPSALDEQRRQVIPKIKLLIGDFVQGRISLDQFKSTNDGINKRQNLWGFRGMNGQMYFNMLFNSCEGEKAGELETVLKACIQTPSKIQEAKSKIERLVNFSIESGEHFEDRRQAPRTGSCLLFISFFWQIQNHERWPMYYNSMVKVLMAESLWSPTYDYPSDYEAFYNLNVELQDLVLKETGKHASLWDIEHAFWIWGQEPDKTAISEEPEPKVATIATSDLPSSYVPPIVAILPQLARNDPAMIAACAKAGISVEKSFEERLGVLFQMLGFQVEKLGQGHGREPDGIASCREYMYGVVFDAKARQGGYSVGTDDRAIREYIARYTERLRKQGIRNVYFAVISSSFNGAFENVVRSLKIETDIREVLFIEVAALVTFLEYKLSNPGVDLGPSGLQGILVQSGVITDADMTEYLGA